MRLAEAQVPVANAVFLNRASASGWQGFRRNRPKLPGTKFATAVLRGSSQLCSGVGTAFPHLFALDYVKHGCDLTDVLVTRRFALLVKSLQWNRTIQCGNSCRQMLVSFELFGAVLLLFVVATPFPHLFFSTISLVVAILTLGSVCIGFSEKRKPLRKVPLQRNGWETLI